MALVSPSSPRSSTSQRRGSRSSNDEEIARQLQGIPQPGSASGPEELPLSGQQLRHLQQQQQQQQSRSQPQQQQNGQDRNAHLTTNATGAALSRASSDDISNRDGRRSASNGLHRASTPNSGSGSGSDAVASLPNGHPHHSTHTPHPVPPRPPHAHHTNGNGNGNGHHKPPRPTHGSHRPPPNATARTPSTASASKRSHQPPTSPSTSTFPSPLGLFSSLSSFSSFSSLGLGLRPQTSLLSHLRPAASSPSAASTAASISLHNVPTHLIRRTLSPQPLISSAASAPAAPAHRTLSSGPPPPSGSASASKAPSPGALIRYLLTPLLLLPVAWPWLVLRGLQVFLSATGVAACAAVDCLVMVAELLRRHRGGAEVLWGWAAGGLGWLVSAYWGGLAQLHGACEDALSRFLTFAAPLAAAAVSRCPPLVRLLRLLGPPLAAASAAQAAVVGAYCWVHDEIVPVALDLAERLPLVHGLLHRAMLGA